MYSTTNKYCCFTTGIKVQILNGAGLRLDVKEEELPKQLDQPASLGWGEAGARGGGHAAGSLGLDRVLHMSVACQVLGYYYASILAYANTLVY